MYKTVEELIKNELSPKDTYKIYNNIENGVLAVNDLIRKNDFFKSDLILNILGRLLSYSVSRSFGQDMLPKSFGYDVNIRSMSFGQKRVELVKDNIKLDLSKTNKSGKLPTSSKYKIVNSLNNLGLNNQLYIDTHDPLTIKDSPNYGVITFGVKEFVLEYVNILVPDHDYKEILGVVDIKPKAILTRVEDIDDEAKFFDVEKIKKDILKNKKILLKM